MPDEQIDVEKTANGSEKAGKRRSGRKPGRPKKDGGLKERILDEAELAFAKTWAQRICDLGFWGWTMDRATADRGS